MQYVLTLTTDPATRRLTADHAASAAQALIRGGATVGNADWLAVDVAVDLPFDGSDIATAVVLVRDALEGLPIDVNAQPVTGRRKRLLIADMDSTIITSESLD